MVLFDVLFVLVAAVALWYGADQFVTGASRLARRLGVPGLVVGLTVVAFGTSAPEFAVTLDAALAGQSDISVANVVGSCVFNVLGVLGLAAVVNPLSVASVGVEGTAWLLGTTLLVLVLFYTEETISRVEGGILVALNAANWLWSLL